MNTQTDDMELLNAAADEVLPKLQEIARLLNAIEAKQDFVEQLPAQLSLARDEATRLSAALAAGADAATRLPGEDEVRDAASAACDLSSHLCQAAEA